jgi:glucuronate isomerase
MMAKKSAADCTLYSHQDQLAALQKRHEYFRRIICNLFGGDVERGELPNDIELVGKTVADICYSNAVSYFGISLDLEEGI